MRSSAWWFIIVLLLVVIGVMAWFLFTTPAPTNTDTATTTTEGTTTNNDSTSTDNGSLSELGKRVVIDAPKANGHVFKTFTVTGKAPGPWYFEASFPIQVRDKDGNVIASKPATALTDWMTTADVPFKADITLTKNYSGPATLVLMKDNPSGLPENEDAVEIPIYIDAQ